MGGFGTVGGVKRACELRYLIRQLKYDDTNKELAVALLDGVRRFYDDST